MLVIAVDKPMLSITEVVLDDLRRRRSFRCGLLDNPGSLNQEEFEISGAARLPAKGAHRLANLGGEIAILTSFMLSQIDEMNVVLVRAKPSRSDGIVKTEGGIDNPAEVFKDSSRTLLIADPYRCCAQSETAAALKSENVPKLLAPEAMNFVGDEEKVISSPNQFHELVGGSRLNCGDCDTRVVTGLRMHA